MFKCSLSRGSSIIAALALVGILSIALLFAQVLLPEAQPRSQTAEAGTAAQRGYEKFNSNAPENCDEAKNAAKGRVFGPDTVNTDKGQSGTVDACFGAFSVTGKPSNDLKDYQCTGRAGSANFVNDMVIVKTSVSKLAPEGKCVVAICKDGKCSGAKAFDGVNMSTYAANPSDPKTALVQNDGTGGGEYSRALSETESGTIRDAFSGTPETAQKALNDAQIAQNNQELEELKQYINSCTETTCTVEDATLSQARLADIERQNAALQEQSDKLASSVKQDVTPKTEGVDPGGDQPGVASICAKTGTCIGSNGKEIPKSTFVDPPGGGGSGAKPDAEKSGGGLGNIGQTLQGLLGGLMKGLGGAGGAAQGPACPSDPTAYAAQQQQYQQQLQQYNYQMQQYQYQQQQMQYQAQMTGYVPVSMPTPPVAPVPCTPGATSNTCAAAPPQPVGGCGTPGYVLKPVTTNQSNGAACTTGWQCVPDGSTAVTPTAQLSCQPQVADVGMTISLSYGCTNATRSSGTGFATLGATSGSTTTVLTAPPAGVNKATFGLTCINQNLTGQASCDVQVSKPSIVLLANPKVVATSTASTVGWVTSGMSSCVVSSPQQADFTAANAANKSVNGMATTSPITQSTDILLHCVTLGGGTRDATTTITIGGAGSGGGGTGTITVSSIADGKNIARGEVNKITWTSAGVPSGSKMSLWLYDVKLGSVTGFIQNELAASGTYSWTLPKSGDACAEDLNQVCATDLVPGRTYGIEADLYTGSLPNPAYGVQAYTPDVFTVSQ